MVTAMTDTTITTQTGHDDDLDDELPPLMREQRDGRRTHRVHIRFSAEHRGEIDAAAASIGMTRTGFTAEAALAAARGAPLAMGAAQDREAMRRLMRQLFEARTAVNRFGNNVNQAVAVLHANGEAPEWLGHAVALCSRAVRNLDGLADDIHRRLR